MTPTLLLLLQVTTAVTAAAATTITTGTTPSPHLYVYNRTVRLHVDVVADVDEMADVDVVLDVDKMGDVDVEDAFLMLGYVDHVTIVIIVTVEL